MLHKNSVWQFPIETAIIYDATNVDIDENINSN